MDFEQVLVKAGGFGLFNKTVMMLVLVLSGFHTALYSLGHFLIMVTPFSQWCFQNGSIPSADEISLLPKGKCQDLRDPSRLQDHNETTFHGNLQFCPSGWQYDRSEFFQTITMETVSGVWRIPEYHGPSFAVIEYTVAHRRTLIAFVWATTWGAVGCAVPWYGYLTQSWRALLYAAAVSDLLLLLCLIWIPESPSWLLSAGRVAEAVHLLQRLASRNGRKVTRKQILELLTGGDKGTIRESTSLYESTKAMLKLPRLRRITLLIYAAWFCISLCYNGCILELGRLDLNIYATYSIAMAFELPVDLFCILTLDVLGRRWPNTVFLIIGGAACITMGLARIGSDAWTMALAGLCITTIAGSYTITYQVASEVFPTVVRGRAVQLQRLLGDLGGLVGMQVAALAEWDRNIPVTVIGAISLVASALAFFLPDTVHLALPQTLDDGERLADDRGLCFCPLSLPRSSRRRATQHNGELCHQEDVVHENEHESVA
ncbi:solute carrier family 22 member 13-like [Rhipicephalus sanguineus]|uniref:solute carrier family 22 member 13-like n=1 Tax=Rhipicephalus sanguineus TaxID=34632 RepID=UPI0020C4A124|nr:solute carrier family 22 member 13-like [Rhipicephalus sanguineus]